MKLYLAGPMAGYYNFNAGSFDRAKDVLESKLHDVVSPIDLDRQEGANDLGGGAWQVTPDERAWFLRRDFVHLLGCDGLVLLDRWEDSAGANLELLVARATGIEVFRYYDQSEVLRPSRDMPQIKLVQEHLYAASGKELMSL